MKIMQPLLKAFLKQYLSNPLNPSLFLLCIASIVGFTIPECLATSLPSEAPKRDRSLSLPSLEPSLAANLKKEIKPTQIPERSEPLDFVKAFELEEPAELKTALNPAPFPAPEPRETHTLISDSTLLTSEDFVPFIQSDRDASEEYRPTLEQDYIASRTILETHSSEPAAISVSFFPQHRENQFGLNLEKEIKLAQIPEPPEPIEPAEPFEPEEPEEPETPPTSSPISEPEAGDIQVDRIIIQGSTLFSDAELAPLIQPYLNRSVSEESLQTLADSITERYLELGYITSRAVLDTNSFASGEINLRVLEGSIEKIEVEGVQKLRAAYVRDRVRLGAGAPLNTGKLEDQLRLLRANPLIDNIEASLRTGSTPVQSILIVRVTEANPFRASGSADNYSPPSVGSERFGFNAGWLNTTGIGDSISLGYTRTTRGGSDTVNFSYNVPLNPMDGTLSLRTSLNRNNVVQENFSALDIRGNSTLYEISFRQPLVKTPREEFALSAGFAYQTGQTFTFLGGTPFGFGPEADGTTTTSIFKFGQDYIRRDTAGAWALRSQFSWGTGLFDATINSGSIPDSRFLSWLLQGQRVQVLNENNFLIISADLQLSTEPLLSSQQFVVGGGQSVRGYRQNARFGDNGLRFSVEDRITLVRNEAGNPTFILAPFFDLGWVWNNPDNPNPQPIPDQTFIAGIGVGFIWEAVPGLNLRLDLAYPLVNLSDRQVNAQDDGLYFSVLWNF